MLSGVLSAEAGIEPSTLTIVFDVLGTLLLSLDLNSYFNSFYTIVLVVLLFLDVIFSVVSTINWIGPTSSESDYDEDW